MVLPIYLIRYIVSLLKPVLSLPVWLLVSTHNIYYFIINLCVGESGLGKSTLINTLFNTQIIPPREIHIPQELPKTIAIQSLTSHIEENGVRLKLTVVDTPGFGDFINNEQR